MLIYQKRYETTDESKNLQSSLILRNSLEGVKLLPLPFFYVEAVRYTGSRPSQSLLNLMCEHGKLKPSYNDICPKAQVEGLLLESEDQDKAAEAAIRPEIAALSTTSHAARRFLLESTWLPAPVVEFVLEKVNSNHRRLIQSLLFKSISSAAKR